MEGGEERKNSKRSRVWSVRTVLFPSPSDFCASFLGNNGESRNNELPFSRTLHQAETNGRQNNETEHAGWPLAKVIRKRCEIFAEAGLLKAVILFNNRAGQSIKRRLFSALNGLSG